MDINGGIVMKIDKDLLEVILSGSAMLVFILALIGTAVFSM